MSVATVTLPCPDKQFPRPHRKTRSTPGKSAWVSERLACYSNPLQDFCRFRRRQEPLNPAIRLLTPDSPSLAQPVRIRFHRLDVVEDNLDRARDWDGEHQSDCAPDRSPEQQRERDRQRIDSQPAPQQLRIENVQRRGAARLRKTQRSPSPPAPVVPGRPESAGPSTAQFPGKEPGSESR